VIALESTETDWLAAFFGGKNELKWKTLADGSARADWASQVIPWLQILKSNPDGGAVVLPIFEGGVATAWYGLAPTGRWLTQLAEELQAWVGPTYSDFSGSFYELSDADPMELAIRSRFGPFAIKFSATSDGDRSAVRTLLKLYHAAVARRPLVVNRGQRPFGRIRGDFDRALLARNEVNARSLLDEMVSSGRVSAEQRKCLDIRLLAGLGKFDQIARDHGLLHSIADIPLPPQTLLDVLEALYCTHIEPIESSGFEAVREIFSQRIRRPYGPLFRQRRGLRHPKVLTAFLLNESLGTNPDLNISESLFDAYPSDAPQRQLGEEILDFVRRASQPTSGGNLAMAKQAMADEDYVAAFKHCVAAIPDPWATRALLRCAEELGTAAEQSQAVVLVLGAPEAVLSSLGPRDRERLERLSGSAKPSARRSLESGWVEWAEHIANGEQATANPMVVLERAMPTWDWTEYARDAAACERLAALLLNARGHAESVFREAFPHLVAFFVDGPPAPVRNFSAVYGALVKIIAWGGIASGDELRLAAIILESLVGAAPLKPVYEETVDDIIEIATANRAPSSIDWALEVTELLIMNPSPAPEIRLRFFMECLAMLQTWAHRLTSSQRAIFSMLALDYECSAVTDSLPAPSPANEGGDGDDGGLERFTGLVGIYTLSEAAGRRACDLLGLLMPLARVELNSDLVATQKLEGLARSADVFAFAWRKSSHPAFYCAKAARGDRELAMPPGGGAASIVRTVLEHVRMR
jgi:hypothetical protein